MRRGGKGGDGCVGKRVGKECSKFESRDQALVVAHVDRGTIL